MDNKEIKKALYKEKPDAIFVSASKTGLAYVTSLRDGTPVNFHIPINDFGDAIFCQEEASQLLCRWIVENEPL